MIEAEAEPVGKKGGAFGALFRATVKSIPGADAARKAIQGPQQSTEEIEAAPAAEEPAAKPPANPFGANPGAKPAPAKPAANPFGAPAGAKPAPAKPAANPFGAP